MRLRELPWRAKDREGIKNDDVFDSTVAYLREGFRSAQEGDFAGTLRRRRKLTDMLSFLGILD